MTIRSLKKRAGQSVLFILKYLKLFWKIEKKYYICRNNQNDNIMKTIEVTIQEIWQATRPIVQKSKKDYTRKQKHKNKYI